MATRGGVIFTLLSVFLWCYGTGAATLGGLRETDAILRPDQFGGVANFSTFLLDRSSGVLFLGARDAIVAVDTNHLSRAPRTIEWSVPEDKRKSCVAKGKTEVDCNNYIRLMEFLGDGRIYVCGTYAFDPQCTFLNVSSLSLEVGDDGGVWMETGKGKCPFEPSQHYTAVMADGILYTAATSNFLGTLFDISRATGPEQERIRTERYINWLSDPEFVSSAFIKQSDLTALTGDDDTIYFFFTEVAMEYDLYTKVKVPRVARVCKSDVGGMKTLQRRWTTYLKAQLVCEQAGGVGGQRYNVLTDMFTLQHVPGEPGSTHFYSLFTSQWEREEVSAVCVYSLVDISRVMDGPFKELNKNCDHWMNPEPVPTPRPGQCLNSALKAQGFESSLKLPDKVLTFMRDHPLMENSVTAAPLLVRRGITYTKLAVSLTTVPGQVGGGAMLHLGTDRGELHRVAVVGQNATLLQEVPLFSSLEPVNNIVLHKGQALVGTPLSLARVGAEGCSLFPSCEVCARARGLGCVWGAKEGACGPSMTDLGQEDSMEDALKLCDGGEARCSPTPRELRVSLGLHVLLPCLQVAPLPCSWEHPPHRHTRQHHSHLEVTVATESLGTYVCTCQEAELGSKEPTHCRRAAYHLSLEGPSVGGAMALAGGRHLLAGYILVFVLGVAIGGVLIYFLSRRRGIGHQGHHLPDHSLSSEKGRDLLSSAATPLSPSSTSLLSEGFPLAEKCNGSALIGHHNNNGGLRGNPVHVGNGGGGHGNGGYSNTNCNASVGGLMLQVAPATPAEAVDGERERLEGGDGEAGEEEDEGLGEGLGEMGVDMKGLEEEMAGFTLFRLPAPLAQCEESSI